MKGIRIKTSVLFFLCACFIIACNESGKRTESPVEAATTAVAPNLHNVKTKLPDAPGYQTFLSNCSICHSASYVQNQPDLPEKTWTAIVTKMQKTFGAPVSDSSAKIIIQYLATIKGKRAVEL